MNRFLGILLLSSLAVPAKDGPKIGEVAPSFQGVTIHGEKIELADFKGKVVLIDFWASWCGPCREEMPYLAELHHRYQNSGFEIIAVNIDEKPENAKKFINELSQNIRFPIIKDPRQEIPPQFQFKGMPSTILLDKNGVIRFWHTGFKESNKPEYVTEINALLKE